MTLIFISILVYPTIPEEVPYELKHAGNLGIATQNVAEIAGIRLC